MTFSKVNAIVIIVVSYRLGVIGANMVKEIDANGDYEAENILTEFMIDLKKFTIDKCDYQDVVVLSNHRWHIQTTVGLTEGIPRIIGSPADVEIPKSLCIATLFVDGVEDFELESIFAKLSPISKNSLWLISMRQNTSRDVIAVRLRWALNMKLRNVKYVVLSGRYGITQIYMKSYSDNCTYEIKVVSSWEPGKEFTVNPDDLESHLVSPTIGRGCPGRVSVAIAPELLRGPEKHLIQTIADDLNFVPVIKNPPGAKEFWIAPNGTLFGVVGEVSREVAEFGIGQLRATLTRARFVDFTTAYKTERMVWSVPLRVEVDIVHSEFSPFIWFLIFLSLFLYLMLASLVSKSSSGKYRLVTNTCDVISMTLNYTVVYRAAWTTWPLLFLLYLMYARIISTAYSTSLASILTTTLPQPAVVEEVEIFTSDLRVAGSISTHGMLFEDTGPNSSAFELELLKRSEVIPTTEEALERITLGDKLAYLQEVSDIDRVKMEFLMKNKPLLFGQISTILTAYSSSIAFPKGSTVVERINALVLRLSQSGILQFWDSEDSPVLRSGENIISEAEQDSLLHTLRSVFFLYLYCLVPTVLIFIGESIVFHLKIDQRLRFWFARNGW
ncbi:glutamate receptor ionotropic, kainate glr-3-like [Athalia rosae]|uniref:glutamate receptor ionotropic, kainate glr-3-like n=1 Tax=Athalia rosae TaxID=37344 RepID=UPI0020336646|nr:glutamate receptor ionotropic, kainate glr-3-like [Athalia rosae]